MIYPSRYSRYDFCLARRITVLVVYQGAKNIVSLDPGKCASVTSLSQHAINFRPNVETFYFIKISKILRKVYQPLLFIHNPWSSLIPFPTSRGVWQLSTECWNFLLHKISKILCWVYQPLLFINNPWSSLIPFPSSRGVWHTQRLFGACFKTYEASERFGLPNKHSVLKSEQPLLSISPEQTLK